MKNEPLSCPSARCEDGSVILGLVRENGIVSIANERIIVDREFVQIARLGRKPEKRFRFASNCVTKDCHHWNKGRCSVIDKVIKILEPKELPDELSDCPIRYNCRWFNQCGAKACLVCPEVITDLTDDP